MRLPDASRLPGLQDKFSQLEKAPNMQTWEATANQDTFTLTNGSYAVGTKTLLVYIEGTLQPRETITELTATSFKLSAAVNTGDLVTAVWLEGKLPVAFAHKISHEKGGQDEIDVTKLANFKEEVSDKVTPLLSSVGIGLSKYAKGDGTDETTKVQTGLNDAAGKVIVFPYGYSFKVNSLTVPDNTIIFGYGAKLYNTSTHQTILNVGNNVKIFGLEIQGVGNSTANGNGVGISIKGTNATSYKSEITVRDCYIHDFGFYGIYAEFAEKINVESTRIDNVGYAGFGGASVRNVTIDKIRVKGVSPGNSNNAYGVYFSRKSQNSDIVTYPRSKDCTVTNSTIEDVTIWEALDTHGGENISFINNTIRNCKVGLAFVSSTGDDGSNTFGAQECTAIGNHIYGKGTGFGIVVQGTTTDPAKNCVVQGNKLYECGEQGNSISGAIHTLYTRGLVVQGNTLRNCYANGINIYTYNKRFSVVGNSVYDVQDSSYTAPACIAFRASFNEGTIVGNVLTRDNTALNTYVSVRGINISVTTDMDLVVGHNNNNCSIPILGGNGAHVRYATYGSGLASYVGSGTPEGVVTAAIGSTYINLAGGAGTTQYVKESGTGNTGWVAK